MGRQRLKAKSPQVLQLYSTSEGRILRILNALHPKDGLKIVIAAHERAKRQKGGQRTQDNRRTLAAERKKRVVAARAAGMTYQKIADKEHVEVSTIKVDLGKKARKKRGARYSLRPHT
jgi:DNA invertase Pin-like site-specific DNA recombinase